MTQQTPSIAASVLTLPRVSLSLLVFALFSPVFLVIGSPKIRPGWLNEFIGPLPASVTWVLVSIVVFVGLTCLFSMTALVGDDASDAEKGPK